MSDDAIIGLVVFGYVLVAMFVGATLNELNVPEDDGEVRFPIAAFWAPCIALAALVGIFWGLYLMAQFIVRRPIRLARYVAKRRQLRASAMAEVDRLLCSDDTP